MANPALSVVTDLGDGKWLHTGEAEAYAKVSRRQLLRHVKMGTLIRKQDTEGRWVYERRSLDMLGDQVRDGDESSDLLDAARQFISTMEGPMRLYVDHLERELKRLTGRCSELEAVNVTMIQARESSLTQAFEREVLGIQAEESEKRKTLATQQGIALVARIMSEQKASAFLSSFSLDQLDTFLTLGAEADILKPDQLATMKALRDQRAAQQQQQAVPATETEGSEVAA